MIKRMIVACQSNANGEPDFFFCKVGCSQEEYEAGAHYQRAIQSARLNDYEGPFVAFDEDDAGGRIMLIHFEWDSATIYTVGGTVGGI